ncbi:centrosomal protein of 192 kDa [Mixophyes fleayi]|uniref:centrosomal protein of 192 kDa n=1 Tax=Mixophyes fleayi TaxID=3061075 RepID=UPI003F4D8D35
MFVARSIAADHKDLIHDVSFDFHGRRMATCSSDQSVKVWDKSENGDWHCTASWKTHSGSVWRVTWAHPEFGQVLASCSFDRTAAVWEEIVGESNDRPRGQSHWVKRTTLVDSRTSVTDVKFAPKHMGLMLATCSADGVVRVYEAPDVMNLSQWSLQHEISCKLSCSCISWNPSSSRAHSPTIAVGSDDTSPNIMGKVQIYEYNENTRKYVKAETFMTVTDPVHDISFAPNLGRSFHILAVASKDVRIFTMKPLRKELTSSGGVTKFEIHTVAQFDNHNSQVWRVSWNITGTVLASSGDDGSVRLWKANYMDNWKCTGVLKGDGNPVNSSHQGFLVSSVGSNNQSLPNSVNGSSSGRYSFPHLDNSRAGSRWSSNANFIPSPSLLVNPCEADPTSPSCSHQRRRYNPPPLKPLPEYQGMWNDHRVTIHTNPTSNRMVLCRLIIGRKCSSVFPALVLGVNSGRSPTMTERYNNIEDETLPSFLGESMNSNLSEALENCTLSSNLGLPVAASTVSKACTAFSRPLDIQASYLENEKLQLPTSNSALLNHSGGDENGKFALSFKDDLEDFDAFIKASNVETHLQITNLPENKLQELPTQNRKNDCSRGQCKVVDRNQTNKISSASPFYKDSQEEAHNLPDAELSTSAASFLENEKLMSVASLDGSSSDELDDEEFYDDQLEAYFKKLLPLGMQRGVIEGQEIQEPKRSSYMALNSLSSKAKNQESERLQYLEGYEEDFQMLCVRLAATGMDSAPASDDEDVELELEKAAQQHLQRERFLDNTTRTLTDEQHRPSFRPGLEGGSSEEESSNDMQAVPNNGAVSACRQSAEGYGLSSPRPSLVAGVDFGFGDGCSESGDGMKFLQSSKTQSSVSRNTDMVTRNVAGEESVAFQFQVPQDRIDPVGNGETSREPKENAASQEKNKTFSHDLQQGSSTLDYSNGDVTQKLDSLYFQEGRTPINQSGSKRSVHLSQMFSSSFGGVVNDDKYPVSGVMATTDADTVDRGAVNRLADAYLSPSCLKNQRGTHDSSDIWQSDQSQFFQWSFIHDGRENVGSTPHSVVYQNEDGKWVTDLAYYKSFENEKGVSFSGEVNDLLNNEDFVVGTNAIAMLDEDQEEFEKEHRFIQEEKMDLENISLNMGDTSWKLPISSNVLLKASQLSDLCQEDVSYLRLSLGEFFGQRSEALGCLGGGQDVKRPSFGYHIISPEKQEPIVLLKESDTSKNSEHDDTIKFCDNTLTPEDLRSLPDDQKFASAMFDVRAPGNKPDTDKHVKEEESLASNTEDQHFSKGNCSELKSEQICEVTQLNMSTIASAIANASCSADPSELAAMLIALSNKHKKMISAHESSEHQQSINRLLHTSLEKSSPENIVDMERYLKSTVNSGQDTESESFAHSLKDFTWDMSLGLKHPLQDSVADLSNITDVQKQDLRKPENSRDIQAHCVKPQPINDISKLAAVKQGGSLGNNRKTSTSHSRLRKSALNSAEMSESKLAAYRPTDTVGASVSEKTKEQNKEKVLKKPYTSTTVPPNRTSNTSEGKAKDSCRLSDFKPGQEENGSLKSSVPSHAKILKSPRRESSHLSNDINCPPSSKDCYKVHEDNTQKHVTFQPSPKDNESKAFSAYAVHTMEEEQYSFRPSTCPLIHSSPSQDSLKISDNGSGMSPESVASVQRTSHAGFSPESSCLSPSLSRLTYVSATESTLQNTTIQSPEKKKSNNTIELSTTIVRASPTPSEMHIVQNNALSWQQNKDQMSSDIPKQMSRSPSGFRTVKSHSIGDNIGDSLKQEVKKLEPEHTVLNVKDKSNTLRSDLLSDAKCCQAPVTQVDHPFSWQEFIAKSSQGLSSANMLQSALLDKCSAMQNIPGDHQYVFAPGFKPVLPGTDLQKLQSSVPTLLTGQPLSTTPFAQQYLGSVTPIPHYPVESHPGYYSTLHSQSTQSTVTGVPQSTHFGSGLLATLPMSNNTSGNQHIGHHMHLLESQSGTTGFNQWSSRMSSGFGQVLVTEEVTFPTACCVGIASQASLNIFNPNERWMQVNIGILSIAVNGEKIGIGADQCLVFKNKTIIGPRASEDIKILLLPQRPGLFQCVLSVSSWPVSADTETIVRAETTASKVLLTAVSEYPVIQVDSGKSDGLDFGDLTSGSWKTLPLKLINRTRATVPIRLTISANATAWRCFNFSKDPVNLVQEFPVHSDVILKMSSPSVISHVMRASFDVKEPELFLIWVVFHAPQTYNSAGSLGPPEEFIARVDVEVDSPGPTCLLKSIPLRARAGCARIHAPKDLQTIRLNCSMGSSAKQLLPLKNAGNIATHLKIKCTDEDKSFTVDPEDLFLVPGEEQVVAIRYTPQYSKPQQSFVKIMVQPSGPQYEVMLVGETELPGNKNSMNSTPMSCSDVPPILSNRQFMSWGGVAFGRTVQQKLILRNTSTAASQHLRLLIRGQDQDCFQLQSTFGPEERLTNNRELTIRPKEDAIIQLMFSPTHVGCMLAKLEIKQSGIKSSQPGIKFTIPLSGYGGTSNIILEGVKKLSDSYMVTVNGLSTDRMNKVSFSVRNTGSRAAYVKAVCFANFQKNLIMDPNSCCVTPEKFVLKEGSQEMVTIFYNATELEDNLNLSSTSVLCTVCFCCGDEVSRQQFRRALLYKPELAQKIIAENTKLKNTRFDEEFPGEQLVSEVYDLPQRPNDILLFYGNMQKTILSVVGSAPEMSTNDPYSQPCLSNNLQSVAENAERHIVNTSLDVLPVKGPQGSLLPNNKPVQNGDIPVHTWSVQPESLVLSAPTTGGLAGTGHIKIVNISSRLLQFDLSWPAHCLTITPQHGSIEPQSHTIILVSPNPFLSTKQTTLPWHGQIYVHCENGQKIVKVQISNKVGTTVSANEVGPKSLSEVSLRQEMPVHVAKPLPKSPSAKIEIKNRTLVFSKTTAGGSSETFLDIENPSEDDVKWLLSSFAPPYVKGVDNSGDIYRATYAAFRCSRVSGLLAAHDKLKVAVTFFPRDRGDYTQFWDLECHPISDPHLKHKVRFQLCGEGIRSETVSVTSLTNSLLKTEVPVKPRRRSGSEASSLKPVQEETVRGVFASEELYTFPSTLVGESSTLKVNLQNNSFATYMLKFVSPKEPFHMKHSKYSLRAYHYINLPVKFKPSATGHFEGRLVVQTDAGDISIQLVGEALAK